MVLVAGAGLKRQRSLLERLRIGLRIRMFKALKLLERLGVDVAARKARYGSADYRNAGAMRPIFVKVVWEDQTDVARQIRCPVALIYGERDTETPPEIGERLAKLIPGATLKIIPGLDHYTVLTDGAPQVVHEVGRLAGGMSEPDASALVASPYACRPRRDRRLRPLRLEAAPHLPAYLPAGGV